VLPHNLLASHLSPIVQLYPRPRHYWPSRA